MNIEKEIMLFNKASFKLSILALLIFIFFVFPLIYTNTSIVIPYNQKDAILGDVIGGISGTLIGFIGIILTFFAFYMQFKANSIIFNHNSLQNLNFEKQQIEFIFFNLLNIHRQNISEMSIKNKRNRDIFIILRIEYLEVYKIVTECLISIKDPENLKKNIISFIYFYFGVGETTKYLAKEYSKKNIKISDTLLSKIETKLLEAKSKGYKDLEKLGKFNLSGNEDQYIPFGGHQTELNHYFNHIHQIIKFVDSRAILTSYEKQGNIDLLLSQFSPHELFILFHYSLTSLSHEFKNEEKENFFLKYKFFSNLPLNKFVPTFNPKKIYNVENYFTWN